MLFTDPQTCIFNAGYTSRYFSPKNSVRQGCCVSPLLFIISVELMALTIRNNSKIQGITINQTEYKITQFADDTTCFAMSEESAEAVLNTLRLFERFSGLAINEDKSSIIPIGNTGIIPKKSWRSSNEPQSQNTGYMVREPKNTGGTLPVEL